MSLEVKRFACEGCGKLFEFAADADGHAKHDAQMAEFYAANKAWDAIENDRYLLSPADIEKVHELVRQLNAEREARERAR